jgi:hypothetical protein
LGTQSIDYFFDKGNILISRDTNYTEPLQQHNTIRNKKKSRYGSPALAATVPPPSRQHLNSRLPKSDSSKKGTVDK